MLPTSQSAKQQLSGAAIFEKSLCGMVVIDARGRVLAVNVSAARMLDHPPDELIGVDVAGLLRLDVPGALAMVDPESGFAEGLSELERGAAPPIAIAVRVHRLSDAARGRGAADAVALIEMFEAVTSFDLDDPFFTDDPAAHISVQGRVVEVNDAFAALLGRSPDALAGADVEEFVSSARASVRELCREAVDSSVDASGASAVMFTPAGPRTVALIVRATRNRDLPFSVQVCEDLPSFPTPSARSAPAVERVPMIPNAEER